MSSMDIDVTVLESGDGRMYAVTLHSDDTITVSDCTEASSLSDGAFVGKWSLASLATVTADSSLALDLGGNRYLDPTATSLLRQWARI